MENIISSSGSGSGYSVGSGYGSGYGAEAAYMDATAAATRAREAAYMDATAAATAAATLDIPLRTQQELPSVLDVDWEAHMERQVAGVLDEEVAISWWKVLFWAVAVGGSLVFLYQVFAMFR